MRPIIKSLLLNPQVNCEALDKMCGHLQFAICIYRRQRHLATGGGDTECSLAPAGFLAAQFLQKT